MLKFLPASYIKKGLFECWHVPGFEGQRQPTGEGSTVYNANLLRCDPILASKIFTVFAHPELGCEMENLQNTARTKLSSTKKWCVFCTCREILEQVAGPQCLFLRSWTMHVTCYAFDHREKCFFHCIIFGNFRNPFRMSWSVS